MPSFAINNICKDTGYCHSPIMLDIVK
jgi:hypothetical protein